MPGERQARREEEAPAGGRASGHLAVVEPDTLADPDESVPVTVARRGAQAVVAYFDAQLVGGVLKRYHRFSGIGVLEGVGEAFLNDPVGGDVDTTRQREAIAGDTEPHGQCGAPDLFQQPAETVEAWLRCQFEALAVLAHGVQQGTHVRQCRAASLLDIGFPR
jgi:hypothetical protein